MPSCAYSGLQQHFGNRYDFHGKAGLSTPGQCLSNNVHFFNLPILLLLLLLLLYTFLLLLFVLLLLLLLVDVDI